MSGLFVGGGGRGRIYVKERRSGFPQLRNRD